jgi:hypothetical protein
MVLKIVQLLLSSSKHFAVLTTNNYSMAILLDGDYVIYISLTVTVEAKRDIELMMVELVS